MLARLFELSRGESNLRPMEGLRGFAVFLVFIVHFLDASGAQGLAVNVARSVGHTGVDLFFVLSGFLIYGSLIAKPQRFDRYMGRRLQRLYPAFTVVFLLYVALSFVAPAQSKIPADWPFGYLLANFLMLPGLFPIDALITVAWSLSYEVFYYFMVPMAIFALRLRARSSRWRLTFALTFALTGATWCYFAGGHVRLVMFLAGVALYEASGRQTVRDGVALCVLLIAYAVVAVPTLGPSDYTLKVGGLFVAYLGLCAACFSARGWLARTFSWAPLRWLGNMSYSYYLMHGLAIKVAFAAVGPVNGWSFWLAFPVVFAATLVPAAALFIAVERPVSLVPRRAKRMQSALAASASRQ